MKYDCKQLDGVNNTGGYECEEYCGKNICKAEDEIAKSIRERSIIEAGLYNARKYLKYRDYCLKQAKSMSWGDAKSWRSHAIKANYELTIELTKIGRLCYKYAELYKNKYEDIYYER